MAAGQIAEVLVCGFEEVKDRLGKVIATGDDSLHVVFLILHRAEQDGIGEIHHLGNATAGGSKENALRFSGTVDDVFGRAEILADQFGFMLVEGALEVRGEEAVHDVHAGREGELGDATKNEGLVGGLLRVLAEEHDPAGVERAVDVVVAAVNVEGVLGEGARADFEDHGGTLAGRVVILLDAVDNSLTGGEVDDALAADGVGDGSALGRVLAFGFNGDGVVAEDVEVTFGIGLLEELAAFSGRRDGIENAGVGDARFSVIADELVAVGGNADAWVASLHRSLMLKPGSTSSDCIVCAGARVARAESNHAYLMIAASEAVRVGLAACQTGWSKSLIETVLDPCQKLSCKLSGRSGKRRPKGKVTPL